MDALKCPTCGTRVEPGQDPYQPVVCPTCQGQVPPPTASAWTPPDPTPPGADAPPPPPPPGAPRLDWEPGAGGQGVAIMPPAWETSPAGLFTRLWETILQVLLHPHRTFRGPVPAGWAQPLAFAVIMGTLGSVLDLCWARIFGWNMSKGQLLALLTTPIWLPLVLFIWTAFSHLFLLLVGASRGGFRATFRVWCYQNATALFHLAPGIGSLVGAVWGFVVGIQALAATHRVGWGRVLLAVLLPALVILLLAMVAATAGLLGALLGGALWEQGLGT